MRRGPRNLVTDVPGLAVGNAHDARVMSGVTVLVGEGAFTAAVDARGGGVASRDCDALASTGTVDQVHAIVLSGGSAFGLSAATGVQGVLAERGIGYPVRSARVPIVPGAILFDLLNGGDKSWGRTPPYEALAAKATERAGHDFEIGSAGAGYGATCADLRGGLGSASAVLHDGTVVGALVAVTPAGNVTIADGGSFWAGPFAIDDELTSPPWPSPLPPSAHHPRLKGMAGESTTLAIVATSATLTKQQAQRLAIMAQTGLARAIFPVHTPLDGDIVFAVSTGVTAPPADAAALARLGAAGANVLARAVARGVRHAAPPPPGGGGPPAWTPRFG